MNILHICTQEPSFYSGGVLCVYQSYYALTSLYDNVDYAGPTISNKEIASKYRKTYYLDTPISKFTKAKILMQMQFDRTFANWKKTNIDFNNYDVIYIEFTKMEYVVKDIVNSSFKGKIVVRAHNVEQDFYRIEFKNEKTLLRFLKYKLSGKSEQFMLRHADRVLAITDNDRKRFMDVYNLPENKVVVFPVGVNHVKNSRNLHSVINGRIKCLITGSLWFGPNCNGVKWFINNVWPMVKDICDLTLAGSRPLSEIKELCIKEGITLIESPDSMQPFFEISDMVLVPIFEGGGMKVKIAEAMSYGLPIVTTSHGAIGYEFENGVNGYIADHAEKFSVAIRTYYNMSSERKEQFLESENNLYKNNYCLEAIVRDVQEIIESLG